MKKTILLILLYLSFNTNAFTQYFSFHDSIFNVGDVLITYDIVFDLDKSEIRPESFEFIDSLVLFLLKKDNLTIEIGNHCDDRFQKEYSIYIAELRASSIKNYLVLNGISEKRIIAKGYNNSKPIIKNAQTEEEHKLNRRTEIKIISK